MLFSVFKYITIFLFLINVRSLPLGWHARVFRPVFVLHFRYYWLRLRIIFKSRQEKELAVKNWFEELHPVGLNPFNTMTPYKTWASIDDSDFNGHLSNSGYAKTYDAARLKMALRYFPSFIRVGGWIALGATHYHFIREIPMLRNYEVRLRIGGWGNKWFYVIARYVSHTKPKKSHTKPSIKDKDTTPPQSDNSNSLSADLTFQANLQTPASGITTPMPPTPANAAQNSGDAMKAIAAAQMKITEEPDGATLHCVAASELCFKHGRITVPPAIVLASSGFSIPAPSGSQPYSHSNPPPHWVKAQLFAPRASRKYREFLRGGWRDVPEGERWWVDALGGAVEERRSVNVEGDGAMGTLRRGTLGAGAV